MKRAVAVVVVVCALILTGSAGPTHEAAPVSSAARETVVPPQKRESTLAREAVPVSQPPPTAQTVPVLPIPGSHEQGLAPATSSLLVPPQSITEPTRAAETELIVRLRFESRVSDVTTQGFQWASLASLNDRRGWGQAGFTFWADEASDLTVILAEPAEVDQLCRPLNTAGFFSCQVGSRVMINADRWRSAIESWNRPLEEYRNYVINHEVGHLIGQGHPGVRCPEVGGPAPVMAQQTKGLQGCLGNGWPTEGELASARRRPLPVGF